MESEKKSHPFLIFIIHRLLQLVPVFFGVIIFDFLLINLAPGSPIDYIMSQYGVASPQLVQQLTNQFGLNKPIWERLLLYIGNFLQGNLGYSTYYNEPVSTLILQRLPATLILMGSAIFFSVIIGVILGVVSSAREHTMLDNTITTLSVVGFSIPIFWLGDMLIITLAVGLGLFPVEGMTSGLGSGGFNYLLGVAWHLFLPALSLGVARLALLARLTRASMLNTLGEDFILTAKAKGQTPRGILYGHALPNASLPIITVVGYQIGTMFAGAILTEIVFAWPGIGSLLYNAITERDYPVVMGVFVVVTIAVLIANLITDIIYARVDPRIRFGPASQ